jgi:hypothetical protein
MKNSREMLFAGVVCAALMLAPGAAFAQHGGGGGAHGGGGGGGHFGGGSGSGSGGGHASAAPASHGSGAGTSHGSATGSGAENTANPNGGGHWWNPFHSESENSAAKPTTGATRVVTNGATAARPYGVVGSPTRVFQPNRPVYGYYPYYPYYYPYYGFGLGWGGAFGPCDPFFGCSGFGNGFGYGMGFGYGFGGGYGYGGGYGGGYGYGGGWLGSSGENEPGWTYPSNDGTSSSGDYTINANGGNSGAELSSNGTNNGATNGGSADVTNSVDASGPTVVLKDGTATAVKANAVLFLKDGTSFAVTDYWLAEGKLHYVASYGGENTIDLGKLDLQRTVDENARLGTQFSLKAGPATQK